MYNYAVLVPCLLLYFTLSSPVAFRVPTRTNFLPAVFSSTCGSLSCLADSHRSRVVFCHFRFVLVPLGVDFAVLFFRIYMFFSLFFFISVGFVVNLKVYDPHLDQTNSVGPLVDSRFCNFADI